VPLRWHSAEIASDLKSGDPSVRSVTASLVDAAEIQILETAGLPGSLFRELKLRAANLTEQFRLVRVLRSLFRFGSGAIAAAPIRISAATDRGSRFALRLRALRGIETRHFL